MNIKKSFLILSFVMVAALFVSCRNSVQGEKTPSGSNEYAYISINVQPVGRSAIVEKDSDLVKKINEIVLTGIREGDDEPIELLTPDPETTFDELSEDISGIKIQTGTWNFTFSAKLEDVAFSGTINSQKIVTGNNTLNFTLAPEINRGGFNIKLILQKSAQLSTLDEEVLEKVVATLENTGDDTAAIITKVFDLYGKGGNEKILTHDDDDEISTSGYGIIYTRQACDDKENLEPGTYRLTFDVYTKGTVNPKGDLIPLNSVSFIVQITAGFNSYINNSSKAESMILGSTYKITYNLNDGDSDVKAEFVDDIIPEFYSYKTPEITLPVLKRQGYEFLGWWYRGAKITKIDPSTTTGNVTLYAKWLRYADASGEIITEDGLLDITVDMPDKIYRNAGTFTFEAKLKGSDIEPASDAVYWNAMIIYKGVSVDGLYKGDPFTSRTNNSLKITNPLPVSGNYQLYVMASLKDDSFGNEYIGSTTSRIFDFEVPENDYLFEINEGSAYESEVAKVMAFFRDTKNKQINMKIVGNSSADPLYIIAPYMKNKKIEDITLDLSDLTGAEVLDADVSTSQSYFADTKLSKLILPKSLKTLKTGSLACAVWNDEIDANVYNLEYIEIPDTIETIEDYVFGYSNILKGFTFYQAGETSYNNPVYSTLYNDVLLLKTSTIQGTDTTESNIIAIAKGADDVQEIDFSTGVLSHYTEIPDALFMNMKNLNSVKLGDNITKIGNYSFSDSGIASISLSKIEEIGFDAFAGTSNLKSIAFNTNKTVTIMFEAFYGSGLTSLNLPKTVYFTPTENGKTNKAFSECNNLKTVTIASDYSNEIDSSIFERCSNIESFAIDGTGGDYSTAINGMFLVKNAAIISVAQGSLKSATIDFTDSGITEISAYVFSPSPNLPVNDRPSFEITSFGSVTKIGEYAFKEAKLTGISDFGSVTEIGRNAFERTAISTISFDTLSSTVDSISYGAFADSELTTITSFGSINNISEYAFNGCPLTSIPPITEGMTIGDKALKDTNLSSVVIKSYNITVSNDYLSSSNSNGIELTLDFEIDPTQTATVTINEESIPIMKYLSHNIVGGIHGIKSVILNGHVNLPDLTTNTDEPQQEWDEELKGYVTVYTYYAQNVENGAYRIFESARKSLESLTFNGANSVIGSYQFHNFENLTTVAFSGSGTKINKNAFNDSNEFHSGAANLTSIDLTGVTVIGENAFHRCLSGVDVVIPESVIAVAPYAFGNYENRPNSITVEGEDNWYSADGANENTWLSWINGTEPDPDNIITTVFGELTGFDPTIENCLLTQNTNYYFRYVQSQP